MTNLEQAAQQLIDALRQQFCEDDFGQSVRDAFAALRHALDQPANWQEIDCPCCGDLARAFPPARVREWVRLDANDYEEIRSVVPNTINDFVFCDMIAIISAKLKERNA